MACGSSGSGRTHELATISFDAGEARTIVVLINVPITDALEKIITDTFKGHEQQLRTLNDVASIAAQSKLDVLGNPVTVYQNSEASYP
jgi:hypothetical protein